MSSQPLDPAVLPSYESLLSVYGSLVGGSPAKLAAYFEAFSASTIRGDFMREADPVKDLELFRGYLGKESSKSSGVGSKRANGGEARRQAKLNSTPSFLFLFLSY